MNKTDLIEALAEKLDTPKAQAGKFLDAFVETVTTTLAEGGSVNLVGFGAFITRDRPARTGRNPQNGKSMEIPAAKKPVFTAGKALKDACNG